ncbi:hypothetical protein SAMN05216275_10539 [Streptosporangium canum]|uniref:Uncharacterized protein n=1 Tax=Streptosporangium canum TaxID=324952 RepID=A0A1I3L7C5_9ACTN|nr:hypothetical protein [Streptosporangium canum]SFI80654.1 hypothetical protein SAMN05216275_10539 [Streptosporangium canum]
MAAEPNYREMAKISLELPDWKSSQAFVLSEQACAYVWGFQDASGEPKNSDEAWDFSMAYWAHALDFLSEKSPVRISIPKAFKVWRETGEIKDR